MTAVSDSFTRANSTNLGASWTEVVGDWEIVSNKCQCNNDAGSLGYYLRYETDTGSSDMFSQIVTSSTQASANSNTGVACRMRAAANTSYQMTTRHAGDTIGNWRIVAAAETQLNFQTGTSSISTTINSGDTLRLEVVGSLLRSKVQGALIGLTVDTTITDGQRAGVNGWNEIASDVVEVDDFAGGALIADGGLLAPFIAGISAQVTGTGTTLTPTVPSNVATGDLVLVLLTSRDAAQTMTAPGSEGWSSVQSPSQTGLEDVLFAKTWGTGSTDDSTPTFSIGAGTAGWGATAVIIRNPAHATFPWTTVASAVVASGSAANASSATVTAPSVNYDGTHVTVARFGSSADDNALLTPSTGALAYGGANYDSTTGNDFAQAMWLREDITVTTNTGTSTVTETLVGNDVNNGITIVIAIPATATNLVVDDASQAQSTDGVVLTQVHSLVVADATQAQSTDAVALTQLHLLTVSDATQAQPADSPALTQTSLLTIDDATQAQASDGITLTQTHVLVVADATHAQSATSPSLSQAHSLTVDDAAQAQSSGSPSLTQAHSLSVADATQAQAADSPVLTQVHELQVDSATHAQSADQVTVTEVGPSDLVVADAVHAQSADNVTLTQVHVLVPADAAQAQAVDSPTLTQVHVLAVADALQGQLADAVALTQVHQLSVPDANQSQSSDNVTLSAVVELAVDDALHLQVAGSPVLVAVEAFTDPNPTIGVLTEPGPGHLTDAPLRLTDLITPVLTDPAMPRLREPR